MRLTSLTRILPLLMVFGTPAYAANITVLELYTSQGCSSCPAAERYLNELASRKNLITLACHIDYWDSLGWKDPYSLRVCSDRQRTFAAVSGDKRIYTPAMVINGERSIVGHDQPDIEILIKKARDVTRVPITYMASTQTLSYQLPSLMKGDVVSLIAVGKTTNTEVPNGENRGKSLVTARPVLSVDTLQTLSGLSHVKLNLPENIAGLVILVNEGAGGPIKAAGQINL
ncbi:MAG: DUF1223 domain-containing protein [Pseudobdellovibrionaceae bacterium]